MIKLYYGDGIYNHDVVNNDRVLYLPETHLNLNKQIEKYKDIVKKAKDDGEVYKIYTNSYTFYKLVNTSLLFSKGKVSSNENHRNKILNILNSKDHPYYSMDYTDFEIYEMNNDMELIQLSIGSETCGYEIEYLDVIIRKGVCYYDD